MEVRLSESFQQRVYTADDGQNPNGDANHQINQHQRKPNDLPVEPYHPWPHGTFGEKAEVRTLLIRKECCRADNGHCRERHERDKLRRTSTGSPIRPIPIQITVATPTKVPIMRQLLAVLHQARRPKAAIVEG